MLTTLCAICALATVGRRSPLTAVRAVFDLERYKGRRLTPQSYLRILLFLGMPTYVRLGHVMKESS